MFQQSVSLAQGFGVQGEVIYDGPWRAAPWQLQSSPHPNVIGATAFTVVSEGIAMAGSIGVFAGILALPKSYANFTGNGGLAPTLTLADDSIGELLTMGTMLALLTTASNIGDLVTYNETTGALASVASSGTLVGSVATTVLTVTGTPTTPLGVGSVITGNGALPGTVIESLGTGTGGAGTYNLNLTQTDASGTFNTVGIPPAGFAFVPKCKTALRNSAANALAIIELTN